MTLNIINISSTTFLLNKINFVETYFNRSSLPGGEDAQTEGLARWKSLDKEEKDRYRIPRLPDGGGGAGKRKREEDAEPRDKKQKTAGGGFASKLAGFARSEK